MLHTVDPAGPSPAYIEWMRVPAREHVEPSVSAQRGIQKHIESVLDAGAVAKSYARGAGFDPGIGQTKRSDDDDGSQILKGCAFHPRNTHAPGSVLQGAERNEYRFSRTAAKAPALLGSTVQFTRHGAPGLG
ncbi:MAG: hypothetical protein AMXMBFR7_51290 [Planctomycetota bacterium]